MGCDCCEVNGELVPDKHTWIVGQHTFGKNDTKGAVKLSQWAAQIGKMG